MHDEHARAKVTTWVPAIEDVERAVFPKSDVPHERSTKDEIPTESVPTSPGSGRIVALESLRGIAAVSVVISHFLNVWFPSVSIEGIAPTYPVERFFYWFPLNALYNGSFAVAIFFVHSGFVLSVKYFRASTDPKLGRIIGTDAKRRIVRLGIPVAASVWIGYGFQRSGAMDQPWFRANFSENVWVAMLYRSSASLLGVAFESFPGSFLAVANMNQFVMRSHNPVLWTISLELIGSALIYILARVVIGRLRNAPRIRYFFYLVSILGLLVFGGYVADLSAFIFGLAIADWYCARTAPNVSNSTKPLASRRVLVVAFILVGLVFGSYRKDISWYSLLIRLLEPITPHAEHALASFGGTLVFLGVLLSPACNRALSHRYLVEMGKRCFSLYLVHLPIIFSVGIGASAFVLQRSWSLASAAALGTVASIVIIVPATELFHRTVDLPSIRAGKRIFR